MYMGTGPGAGETVLLVQRVQGGPRGTAKWVVVRPNRRLRIMDLRNRSAIKHRKSPGVVYAGFPALSREEKAEVEDLAREMASRAGSSSAVPGLHSLFKGIAGAVATLFAAQTWGSGVAVMILAWRIGVYFNLATWLLWTAQKFDDFQTYMDEMTTWKDGLAQAYREGHLELPLLILSGTLVLLSFGTNACWRRKTTVATESPHSTPPGSDADSDGVAGHDLDSGDELHDLCRVVAEMRQEQRAAPPPASPVAAPPRSSTAPRR